MNRIATTVAPAAILTLMLSVPALAGEDTVVVTASTTAAQMRLAKAVARPKLLPALYLSYAALQAYDVVSTKQGLARGAREANPLMQGVVGNNGAFLAMKAVAVVGTIVAAERLWKTNKA